MPEGNGGVELDDDTVVRPRRESVANPSDIDADTVIRERAPFADLPPEVRALVARPAAPFPAPTVTVPEVIPSAPEPVGGQSPDDHVPSRPAPSSPLAETQPMEYSFRVNAHEPIALDKPALIGRRPSLPRITPGRPPRLVRVPSPLREVSGTHVELRQQGTLVIVTDLRSTNGSTVRLPGRDPVRLLGGESLVVIPGTVVDIGDGNLVEILSLDRSTLEDTLPPHPAEGTRP